jgi:tRNA threonylcarbamoyladenosine biosynthesis protein TsaE
MGADPTEAVSPTFTLCNIYPAKKTIFHLDLYRLNPDTAAEEFVGAGLEDCLDGMCLVEWPDKLNQGFWPNERLELKFEINGESRILMARGLGPVAERIWRSTGPGEVD